METGRAERRLSVARRLDYWNRAEFYEHLAAIRERWAGTHSPLAIDDPNHARKIAHYRAEARRLKRLSQFPGLHVVK